MARLVFNWYGRKAIGRQKHNFSGEKRCPRRAIKSGNTGFTKVLASLKIPRGEKAQKERSGALTPFFPFIRFLEPFIA
jgi:hypothetical protein